MKKILFCVFSTILFFCRFASAQFIDAAGFEYSQQTEHTYERVKTKDVDEKYPSKIIKLKKRQGSPHSFATVYVAGKRLGDFLLDTGATCVVMTPQMIAYVPTPNKRFLGTTNTMTANGPSTADLYVLNRVGVGGVIVDNVQVFVLEKVDGGLLGMSLLSALGDISIKKNGTELHYSN